MLGSNAQTVLNQKMLDKLMDCGHVEHNRASRDFWRLDAALLAKLEYLVEAAREVPSRILRWPLLERSCLREQEQLNVLRQTKGSFDKNTVKNVMLDGFKDEFLKIYDREHPRASHRGLVALDESGDDASCDDSAARESGVEQDNWEADADEHGHHVCKEEDCEDTEQTMCDDDDEYNAAFLNFREARHLIRQT